MVSACGDDDDDGKDTSKKKDAGGQDTDVKEEDTDEEDAGAVTKTKVEAVCGDGEKNQALEECDDGNFFEHDGCTQVCEYSCHDDSECDDGNICNGLETCNDDHRCVQGAYAKDGEDCASLYSCFAGLCLKDVCGDKLTTPELGEECDDGNTDDTDGCTRQCKYTCASDKDCQTAEPCLSAPVCDPQKHVCSGTGMPIADRTLCTESGNAGWCINGACVPTNCGNGQIEGTEECDRGTENGQSGSPCARDCKNVACGNGRVEGDEQCDDGNKVSLDNCDENCKTEIFVRWTNMNLLRDPAPEWCKHPGQNRFAEAFSDKVKTPFGEFDVLEGMINSGMSTMFDDCSANPILQIFDLEDLTFTRSDDQVHLSSYNGALGSGQTCSSPMSVNTGFYLKGTNIDQNNHPIKMVDVVQRPGVIRTLTDVDLPALEGSADSRVGALKDYMMLLPVDTGLLSTPAGSADSVKIPEKFGFNDPAANPYRPKGLVCAAMDTSGIAKTPLTSSYDSGGICCKSEGGRYRVCQAGQTPGVDCDSQLDLFRSGCKICLNGTTIDCDNCANGMEIIRPVQMDIDTNDDGEPDAYSIVVAVEGKRVRSLGVQR
jgi:cysteine-rich repeat protein